MDAQLRQSVLVVQDFIGGNTELGQALTRLSELATDAFAADMAGLTLNDASGRARTAVYTDRTAPEIDQAQYDADRGPCLDAFRKHEVFLMEDAAEEERWPEFAAAALAHGMRSSISLPLLVGAEGIGALNLYCSQAQCLDDEAVAGGVLFAGQAAIVAAYYDKADTADHLRRAMESRAEIEQAKGVIMASVGCSAEEAFDLLRQQSQTENRKLREVAAETVLRQHRR
jgi:transcriptional regulator with GAF, ATPase, and Fis domain